MCCGLLPGADHEKCSPVPFSCVAPFSSMCCVDQWVYWTKGPMPLLMPPPLPRRPFLGKLNPLCQSTSTFKATFLETFSLTLFQPGLPHRLTTILLVGWLQTAVTKETSWLSTNWRQSKGQWAPLRPKSAFQSCPTAQVQGTLLTLCPVRIAPSIAEHTVHSASWAEEAAGCTLLWADLLTL